MGECQESAAPLRPWWRRKAERWESNFWFWGPVRRFVFWLSQVTADRYDGKRPGNRFVSGLHELTWALVCGERMGGRYGAWNAGMIWWRPRR